MDAQMCYIEPGSIAWEAGLEPGDVLVKVNGRHLCDILDYRFLTANEELELEVRKKDGQTEVIEIYNGDFEDLGITFTHGLLDRPRACKNKCVFCFIDQLPKGLRQSLYFKDDDYRLSALMGNYITLTNLSAADVQRIIDLHLPRINVSVHTTDPALRRRMISNPNSDVLAVMKRFRDAGITMECQIVTCPGYNDGDVLDQTIADLAALYPAVQSISAVPVGLTKFREGLPKLRLFDKIGAQDTIGRIEAHQKRLLPTIGTRLVYASDEFYILAGLPMPAYEDYEAFYQLENGVGMVSLLEREFLDALAGCERPVVQTPKTSVTGVSSFPFLNRYAGMLGGERVEVVPIENHFFGETITVTGLLTATDIIRQLQGQNLGGMLLIPAVTLNCDGLFLDDLTVADVEQALQIKVVTVENDGRDLLEKFLL